MKLLSEDEGRHLPDAAVTLPPWYAQWLRRFITRAFSTTGITICIGISLIILLTSMISLNYMNTSQHVDKNGISLADFYATEFRLEMVDKEATQRKIDRTKQSLSPIYQDETPHNQDILHGLEKLLSDLTPLALNTETALPTKSPSFKASPVKATQTEATALPDEKRTRFLQLFEGQAEAEALFERYFTKTIDPDEWAKVQDVSRSTMRDILKGGFTEADDQLKRQATIRSNVPAFGYKSTYRDLIYFLVNARLQPNRILDESAMKRKQEEVAAQISQEPEIRVFTPGQKIVGKGEKVSLVQMEALEKIGKSAGHNTWLPILGVFLLSMLFVFTLWSYLYNFQNRQFFRPAYAALIATLIIVTIGLMQVQQQGAFGNIPLFAFPLATFALTLAIFTHPHISVFSTTLLVFLAALSLRADFQSLSILLFGSIMGIYVLSKRINRSDRGHLMYAGFYVGATNALILMAISLMKPNLGSEQDLSSSFGVLDLGFFSLRMLLWSFFSGVFSGIFTIGSLPLLESLFRLVTPYTLMELGNHDRPLLKRMQFEAPGTFHHSLMVATLAESAAEAIGANALLTRVGCLYHDIGKMKRPLFFIENQAYFGVENPHDKLTPRLSKMVITAHPRDSIEMAKQNKLPECLMHFMTEHHGTLTAGYFYNKACMEEGAENVNKSQFRYPGPKPGSKETAIVMLADACESAVRALKNPSVAQVEERIDKIVQQRIEESQFDNCPITLKDISLIKQTFVRILRGIQHNRIEYQQNMMRELGRKMPNSTATEHQLIQDSLKQAQKSAKSSDARPETKTESGPSAADDKNKTDKATGGGEC